MLIKGYAKKVIRRTGEGLLMDQRIKQIWIDDQDSDLSSPTEEKCFLPLKQLGIPKG
jgi:hypothetical protein